MTSSRARTRCAMVGVHVAGALAIGCGATTPSADAPPPSSFDASAPPSAPSSSSTADAAAAAEPLATTDAGSQATPTARTPGMGSPCSLELGRATIVSSSTEAGGESGTTRIHPRPSQTDTARLVASAQPRMEACCRLEPRASRASGRVVVRLSVAADGVITDASVDATDLLPGTVTDCWKSALRALHFGASASGYTLVVPVVVP